MTPKTVIGLLLLLVTLLLAYFILDRDSPGPKTRQSLAPPSPAQPAQSLPRLEVNPAEPGEPWPETVRSDSRPPGSSNTAAESEPRTVVDDRPRSREDLQREEEEALQNAINEIRAGISPPNAVQPIEMEEMFAAPPMTFPELETAMIQHDNRVTPPEILQALSDAQEAGVQDDLAAVERAIQEANEKGTSEELRHYMQFGGELPPELR